MLFVDKHSDLCIKDVRLDVRSVLKDLQPDAQGRVEMIVENRSISESGCKAVRKPLSKRIKTGTSTHPTKLQKARFEHEANTFPRMHIPY